MMVVSGVVERHGRILMALRHKTSEFGDMWEFPGGKVETGETATDALKREFLEELNVEITSIRERLMEEVFVPPSVREKFTIVHWLVNIGDSTPMPCASQKLNWVTMEEASMLSVVPSVKAVLNTLNMKCSVEVISNINIWQLCEFFPSGKRIMAHGSLEAMTALRKLFA